MDKVLEILLNQGVLGAVCVVLGVAYYRKDRECAQAHTDRITDNEKSLALLVSAQAATAEAQASTVRLANEVKTLVERRGGVR